MDFDLDQRTARLSVGEFADFTLGPRESSGGPSGLWRAQLGTHWHQQLRAQTTHERADALFEVPVNGQVFHRGWTLTLNGRIDQFIPGGDFAILREIKTVTRELPADEAELRAEYPGYVIQLATYAALLRLAPDALPTGLATPTPPPGCSVRAELHFVEVASGLAQTLTLSPADETLFRAQLERVVEFLDLRLRARERLRHLAFRPPFTELRAGQETTQAELAAALASHSIVFFEAPTGFGKTGALLELALGQLRSGRFERLVYLTSKATGQLQVMRTLAHMSVPGADAADSPNLSGSSRGGLPAPPPLPVAAWLVRPKREHCIHTTYHCSRDVCPHLADVETRWARSGLSRFYLLENEPRDLAALRAAGREAGICPYEITRAALPFNDVWIGDYNYVFAPANRGLFLDQPGFVAARTLLVVDEAHNLPSRVADVYTHAFSAVTIGQLRDALHRLRAHTALVQACNHWEHFLRNRAPCDALPLSDEDDARHLLTTFSRAITSAAVDTAELGPDLADVFWQIPPFVDELASIDVPRLWWSPRAGELVVTCLDAAAAIAPALRNVGAVVLASATLTPTHEFAAACGLDAAPDIEIERPTETPARLGKLNKRDTRRLYAQLTSGAELLKVEEARESAAPALVRAIAPWRDHAYDVAIDVRVDTSYQQRSRHAETTAATVAALASAPAPAGRTTVATFFSSYAYAETIQRELTALAPHVRVALQPRLPDLNAQNAWMEQSLASADALFLVLGSSFAEGIDLLGGRISHAMVVGPALPEVNPVQRARLAALASLGRDTAFRRVYQLPGIQKVNQALGRLVRAPGQRAKVLLHCRRFAEASYGALLASEYRSQRVLETDGELATWLAGD
jgi:DNA excision repair protein ERCC-2